MLQVIASLKVFDQIYLLQLGTPGPENSTRPAIQYIYEAGFTQYRVGYASAMSFVFFLVVVAVGLLGVLARPARRHADGGARHDRRTRAGGWVAPLLYAFLVALAIIWLVPLAWAVATSLKPDPETTIAPVSWRGSRRRSTPTRGRARAGRHPALVLQQPRLHHRDHAAATIVTASLAAFAFSRMRFRGRDLLQWLVLAGLIVPFQALIVPLFNRSSRSGWSTPTGGSSCRRSPRRSPCLSSSARSTRSRASSRRARWSTARRVADLLVDLDAAVARHDRRGRHLHVRARGTPSCGRSW